MADELTDFVREALGRGLSRQDIGRVLAQAGWSAEQIQGALRSYADLDFPVPVPRPRSYLSPRDAFLHLVLFTTLYITAYHLGSLLFLFIERAFPDPADSPFGAGDYQLRWAVASLIIAFPVFLFTSRTAAREIAADPTKRASRVRRWLTYLTLFVAASIVVGDGITLVYNLLGGELTIRFLLKVVVVAAIAGSIFWHYLGEARLDEREAP